LECQEYPPLSKSVFIYIEIEIENKEEKLERKKKQNFGNIKQNTK
jgi:hypothetical protein